MTTLLEHQEQSNFVAEVFARYGNRIDFIRELFFAVPSGFVAGGKNKFALLGKLQNEGWHSGVADLHYLQPRGKYPYMAIEMKRSDKRNVKNGGLSPEQMLYIEAAKSVGAYVRVCYTAEEAMDEFDKYMRMEAK